MFNKFHRFNRRHLVLSIIFLCTLSYTAYYHRITQVPRPFIPGGYFAARRRHAKNLSEKVSIAHYTTIYGSRIDSKSKIFSGSLGEICETLDPEDFIHADSVYVSLVDFARFPTWNHSKLLYRQKFASQLWVMSSEESPRNSYRTVEMNNITELDDWFNLTSTLKPESDFPIQYKVTEHHEVPRKSLREIKLFRDIALNRRLVNFSKRNFMSI